MEDPSRDRFLGLAKTVFRVFFLFWYGWCVVAVLFGLLLSVAGLSAILDLQPFGIQFADDAGPGFLVGSLFSIAMGIAFFFIGRACLNPSRGD